MTKGLKYGALSIIASALLSTSAFGITLTDNSGQAIGTITGNTAQTKASELSTSAAIANINLGNYVPHGIDLTTLSNPTFNYAVEHGTLALAVLNATSANLYYYIVEVAPAADINAATNKVVAKYTAGTGTSTLAFGATGPQVSNGGVYVIVQSTDNIPVDATKTVADIDTTALVQTGITYTQTGAATADRVVVNLGQGDSQTVSDVAVATILTAAKQVCASVTGVQKNIDPSDNFKSFNLAGAACGTGAQTTIDTIVVNFKAQPYNINAVGTTDKAIITVNASNALPVGTVATVASSTIADVYAVNNVCSAAAGATSFTCTTNLIDLLTQADAVNPAETVTITITVDGTHAISRTAFTADVEYNFLAEGATDYLKTNANPLLVGANANTWNYRGTTITIPTMNSNADTNTMVKLNNDSLVNSKVLWTLIDDAGNKVESIEINSASGVATLGAAKSDTWMANTLRAAALAVKPAFGEKFRGEAVVTSETGVSAVSVMMINGGRDRVIPLNSTTTAP